MIDFLLERLLVASLEGAVFAGAVLLLTRLVRALAPGWKAALWWAVCAKFLLALAGGPAIPIAVLPPPPVPERSASPSSPATRLSTVPDPSTTAGASGIAAGTNARDAVRNRPRSRESRRSTRAGASPVLARVRPLRAAAWALALAWIAGALVEAAGLVRTLRRATRLRWMPEAAAPPAVQDAFRRTCDELGLRNRPMLRIVAGVDAPQVMGILRPVLLMPAERVATLDPDELRMVLRHELAHVRRGDLPLAWVPALARAAFFFHPAVRLAVREYALAREAACDAWAVGRDGDPATYGRVLLSFAVRRRGSVAGAIGASASFQDLQRRLVMLEGMPDLSRFAKFSVLAIAVAGFIPVRVVAKSPSAVTGPVTLGAAAPVWFDGLPPTLQGAEETPKGTAEVRMEPHAEETAEVEPPVTTPAPLLLARLDREPDAEAPVVIARVDGDAPEAPGSSTRSGKSRPAHAPRPPPPPPIPGNAGKAPVVPGIVVPEIVVPEIVVPDVVIPEIVVPEIVIPESVVSPFAPSAPLPPVSRLGRPLEDDDVRGGDGDSDENVAGDGGEDEDRQERAERLREIAEEEREVAAEMRRLAHEHARLARERAEMMREHAEEARQQARDAVRERIREERRIRKAPHVRERIRDRDDRGEDAAEDAAEVEALREQLEELRKELERERESRERQDDQQGAKQGRRSPDGVTI